MEKVRISPNQLLYLIILFELGSAIVIGYGMEAKQDAWLAALIAMGVGIGLFYFVYRPIFKVYPDIPLTAILEKVFGKYLGKLLVAAYVWYFAYLASRVLRDFGELLLTAFLDQTPLSVVIGFMLLVVMYATYLGIQSIAKSAEILIVVIAIYLGGGISLVFFSDVLEPQNLLPFLEHGLQPLIKTVFPTALTFPFGEMVVFLMMMPLLTNPGLRVKTGILGMLIAGTLIAITTAIDIAVLGLYRASNATFPLLLTAEKLKVGDFLEGMDAFALSMLIICGYFKITVFFYAAVAAGTGLFGVKKGRVMIVPIGLTVIVTSIFMTSSFVEHIETGLEFVTYWIHLPLQIGIPFLILIGIWIKKFKRDRGERLGES